jgi:1,4-dihydroxy-2-naphthoate octaprenyltransferase
MRLKTLPAGACPVVIAAAMAAEAGHFHALPFIACLAGALLIQIGTNFANDYSDGLRGTDAERIGPPRAVASGRIKPQVMKGAIVLTFAAVFIPGAYITRLGGPLYLLIGVASIASGLAYTGGPYPLGYHGWGEFFVLAFFGPVAVCATYYLMAFDVPPEVIAASFAPGLFSVAILTVNNLRDIDGDRKAGKHTLAARFGKGFARAEYLVCLLAGGAGVPVYLATQTKDHPWVLLACAALLPTLPSAVTVFRATNPRQLNPVLGRTGAALVLFTVLFSIGWMI